MPDLQLGPPPSSGFMKPLLLSLLVLAVIAAGIFFLNPRKTADIAITGTQLAAPHTQMKALPGTVHVLGAGPVEDDDVYVAVRVSITDKLRLPLFVKEAAATLTTADSRTLDADVILPADMPALTQTFPQLAPLTATPLPRDIQIAPGTTATGDVLIHFAHFTAVQWSERKDASLTVNFFHQAPQTLRIP